MGWTKRQFIDQAFEEIGLASYVFDLTADQLNSALVRLDAMMAEWLNKGINVSWPLSANLQNSDITAETSVPIQANSAILLNLGVILAPSYGKNLSIDTKKAAKTAYDTLLSLFSTPVQQQFPNTLPRGAGARNSSITQPFILPPNETPLRNETDTGQLIFQ
jgi:hypothetical protein